MNSIILLLKLALIFFCPLQNKMTVKGETSKHNQDTKAASTTKMVNIKFCYRCHTVEENSKIGSNKNTLEEIHTYAELQNDPKASLPDLFTTCFNSMITYDKFHWQVFFVLLGKDRNTWLSLGLINRENRESRFIHWGLVEKEMPLVFAQQWVRSCVAINAETGLLQWVVDGILVENYTVPQIKDNKNKPTNLRGHIAVGAYQNPPTSKWMMLNYQALTNMNIFSRALTIDEMVENTKENNCNMEGDYLAWREMRWNLKGEAVIDTEYLDQACKEHPIYSLYPKSTFVVPFSTISSCMNFCEKLGNRALSVTTLTQWKKI